MSLSRFILAALAGSLFYLLLVRSGVVHAECHPVEKGVYQLNTTQKGKSCQLLRRGAIEKLDESGVWVLLRYRSSSGVDPRECPDLTEYVTTSWEYGMTCTNEDRWERLQAVRQDFHRRGR